MNNIEAMEVLTAQNNRGGQRLYSLDTIKAIAAIGVVLIHFSFPGSFGRTIQLLARFGVPFFFMVSGYFCYKDTTYFTMRNALKKVRHIIKITVAAVCTYLIGNMALNGIESIVEELSLANIAKIVIFNAPQITSAHLWFLLALIYAYPLLSATLWILSKQRNTEKWLFIGGAVLLVTHIGIVYGSLTLGHELPHPFVRNAYLFAHPFLMIGYGIHLLQTKLKKVSNGSLIIVFVAGCVLSIAEGMLYPNDLLELYAGSILMTISVFMLAIKNENFGRDTFINYIGKNYSMVIYVIHILVGMLLSRFITIDWAGYGWIKPLIIAFLSLAIAMIYDKMKIAFCKRG